MSYLIVKWNSFWQEGSPRMVVRLAEAGLYASLASPGPRACDPVGGAFRPEWREGASEGLLVRSHAGLATSVSRALIRRSLQLRL